MILHTSTPIMYDNKLLTNLFFLPLSSLFRFSSLFSFFLFFFFLFLPFSFLLFSCFRDQIQLMGLEEECCERGPKQSPGQSYLVHFSFF